jgi:hypothetical protein
MYTNMHAHLAQSSLDLGELCAAAMDRLLPHRTRVVHDDTDTDYDHNLSKACG